MRLDTTRHGGVASGLLRWTTWICVSGQAIVGMIVALRESEASQAHARRAQTHSSVEDLGQSCRESASAEGATPPAEGEDGRADACCPDQEEVARVLKSLSTLRDLKDIQDRHDLEAALQAKLTAALRAGDDATATELIPLCANGEPLSTDLETAVLAACLDVRRGARIRCDLLAYLCQAGSNALPGVLQEVWRGGPDRDLARVIVRIAGMLGDDPAARGMLREGLRSPHAAVRSEAVSALAPLAEDDARTLEEVLQATRGERDPRTRAQMIRVIGEIGGSEARTLQWEVLEDPAVAPEAAIAALYDLRPMRGEERAFEQRLVRLMREVEGRGGTPRLVEALRIKVAQPECRLPWMMEDAE